MGFFLGRQRSATQLTTLGGQVHVDSWSADGRTLSLHRHPPQGANDIYMLAMDRPGASPEVFYAGEASKESAEFSRDREYVRIFPLKLVSGKSTFVPIRNRDCARRCPWGGGREPVWARNGELFYRSPDGEILFSVSVRTAPTLNIGTAVQVFRGYYISPTGSPRPHNDVSADGRRFLMLAPTTPSIRLLSGHTSSLCSTGSTR